MKCRIYGIKNIKEYVGIYHDNFIKFSNYNYLTLNNIEDFTKNIYESYKNCYLLVLIIRNFLTFFSNTNKCWKL